MAVVQQSKQGNGAEILRLIREGGLSRAELSRRTGLSRAAVTGIVDRLIAEGLVREGEATRIAKGRRPTLLELAPEAFYAVGLDISREGTNLCFLDFTMRPVWERTWSADLDREQVLCELVACVQEASHSHRFLGVGVVAPGPLDTVQGRITEPKGLEKWHGFCVAELGQRLGLPTVLKKDTAALAVAEKPHLGSKASFLVLLADHGLGGGYVYQGGLFEPGAGLGCELGHISINTQGELCSCGNRGCASLTASIPAALARAKERMGVTDWHTLVKRAEAGDRAAEEILGQQAEALCAVCVNAVNVLEPECIVLEGQLVLAHAFLGERIERALAARCFTQNGRAVRVLGSELPQNARAFSAANLILDRFFEENGYDRIRKL